MDCDYATGEPNPVCRAVDIVDELIYRNYAHNRAFCGMSAESYARMFPERAHFEARYQEQLASKGISLRGEEQRCGGCGARKSICWCGESRSMHRRDNDTAPDGRRTR